MRVSTAAPYSSKKVTLPLSDMLAQKVTGGEGKYVILLHKAG